MSKCVLHMMKHDRGAVSGIQSHVNREHEPRTNRDIDATRTELNYHLVEPPASYHKAIKQRIDALNLKRAVRKDAVLMCSFIVSSDKGFYDRLSQEQQRAFFADAVKFFQGRYGKENVIAATVHMDEATPHMHLCLTPIRDGKLSAKAMFTRQELKDLQTQFAASVGEKHDLERGEENSKAEHLSELDYKLKARTQELEVARKEMEKLQTTMRETAKELEEKRRELAEMEKKLQAAQQKSKAAQSPPQQQQQQQVTKLSGVPLPRDLKGADTKSGIYNGYFVAIDRAHGVALQKICQEGNLMKPVGALYAHRIDLLPDNIKNSLEKIMNAKLHTKIVYNNGRANVKLQDLELERQKGRE